MVKDDHTRLIASHISDAQLVILAGNHFVASKYVVKCGRSLEVVVKTWSRINSVDGRPFSEDSGKSINFDSHSI
jgi:hypothetical protein